MKSLYVRGGPQARLLDAETPVKRHSSGDNSAQETAREAFSEACLFIYLSIWLKSDILAAKLQPAVKFEASTPA